MIVADVNVVVYLLTDCPQRERAVALFQRDSDWWMPHLWRHEFLNIVVTLTRNGLIPEGEAIDLWRNGLELFGMRELQPNQERAIELAMAHGISGYDAQYVTLAEELGTELLTGDARLLRKIPELCRGLD